MGVADIIKEEKGTFDTSLSLQPQESYPEISQEQPSLESSKLKKFLFGRPGKVFSICVMGFMLLVLTIVFLAIPHQVKGEPIELFKKNQYVLSEKATYLFRPPKIGDRIIFRGEGDVNFVGIITNIESKEGKTLYITQSGPGKPWQVSRDRIKSRIYFPFVSGTQIQNVIATITPSPSPTPEVSPSPEPITSPVPTEMPGLIATPTPAPTIPPLRGVSVSGFAYEDRNDDGLFNSDDPKLPYMQFYLYDSYKPEIQISTIYSDESGNFSIALNVRGNLVVRPTTYNNFRPRGGQLEFSLSTSNIEFGFRSVGAPVPGQVGIIEGDIFQDSNRNGVRDGGEQGIYFYKLYLVDNFNNYYNTDRNTQTTDPGGHFKFVNLPVERSYTLRLSNPTGDYTIDKPETYITLTSTQTQFTNLQIPVYKTSQ